jgi:hypothetical protein
MVFLKCSNSHTVSLHLIGVLHRLFQRQLVGYLLPHLVLQVLKVI